MDSSGHHRVVTSGRPIFERFPALRNNLPLVLLGYFPTNVRLLEKSSGGEIWVKDDGKSSDLYGGNKVRKLELILGAVGSRGSKRIITIGGIGSHHVLATAIFADRMGIRTTGVLVDQPFTAHVNEVARLAVASGARLVPAGSRSAAAVSAVREMARSAFAGERPYLLLPGGSTPQFSLAYVNAALELAEQVRCGECPEPETIFVAAGSGGTAAGLLLGLDIAGLRTRLHAVQVVEPPVSSAGAIQLLAELARRRLGKLAGEKIPVVSRDRLVFETGYLGAEYGAVTPESGQAVAWGRDHGLRLETTYTGKTLACLLERARSSSGCQLFWNTHNGADLSAEASGIRDSDLPPALLQALERGKLRS